MKKKRGRTATFQGVSFAPLSQQNITGASHVGYIVSKSKYLRKTGTFSETGQVMRYSKEQSEKTEEHVKASTQARFLVPAGRFSQILLEWPFGLQQKSLLNTHSSNNQILPWECFGRWLCKQQWSPQEGAQDLPAPGPQYSRPVKRQVRTKFILFLPI